MKQSSENNRALETEDPLTRDGAVEIFDREGFLRVQWHPEILAVVWPTDCYKSVNSRSG